MPAPPLPLDRYGRPPSMSFFELFIGTGPRMKRSSYRNKHAKTKTPTASTASFHPGPVIDGPAAPFFEAPAPEAPMVQAPVDEAPVEEAPAIDAFNPDAANTGDEEGVWFTTLEDHALVGMKLQNMGWAEISDAMPDKGVEFLKLRYLELYEAAHDNIENGGEGSSKRKETPLKGILKNKSRVHIQANPDSNDDSDGSSCDSFIDPAPPPFSPMYQAPQIVIEANEYLLLSKLTKKNDAEKWLEIASRFFDKTGKRVPPHVLKEFLKGIEDLDKDLDVDMDENMDENME